MTNTPTDATAVDRPASWSAPLTPDLNRSWPAVAYQLDHLYGLVRFGISFWEDIPLVFRSLDDLARMLDDMAKQATEPQPCVGPCCEPEEWT